MADDIDVKAPDAAPEEVDGCAASWQRQMESRKIASHQELKKTGSSWKCETERIGRMFPC